MKKNLNGETAFVVGGSSGIGASTVRSLAEAGARVAVGFRSGASRSEELIASLPNEGHLAVQIDVSDSQSVSNAAAKVEEVFGALNILVNSAAVTKLIPHTDLVALNDDFFDTVMQTNVRGVFSTIRACKPMLEASGDAVIINISSVAGVLGNGSNIAYGASKGAVDTMTISLARAFAPNIRVLAVSPGIVATGFIPGVAKEQMQELGKNEPMGRVCEPEDIADAVMACITHLTMSTGSRIFVDGGRSI